MVSTESLVQRTLVGHEANLDWPGLSDSDLHEGRDLRPTIDVRSLFKGVLLEHMHLDEAYLEAKVFPDSRAAKAMSGLIRAP